MNQSSWMLENQKLWIVLYLGKLVRWFIWQTLTFVKDLCPVEQGGGRGLLYMWVLSDICKEMFSKSKNCSKYFQINTLFRFCIRVQYFWKRSLKTFCCVLCCLFNHLPCKLKYRRIWNVTFNLNFLFKIHSPYYYRI